MSDDTDTIRDALASFGLGQVDVAFCKALINKGRLPPPKIALLIGISRTAAYNAASRLEARGLIQRTTHKGVANVEFVGVPVLERHLFDLKAKADRTEQAIGLVRAAALKRRGTSRSPSVEILKGSEGLKVAYIRLLESARVTGGVIAGLAPRDFDDSAMGDLGNWFIAERLKRNVSLLCLEPEETALRVAAEDERFLRQTRVTPVPIVEQSALIEAAPGLALIITYLDVEAHVLVIDHPEICRILFGLVREVWASAAEPAGEP